MLKELFSKLKVEWEQLGTNTKDWISYLESKYSKGSDAETKAVRESLSNMRFLLTAMNQQMQGANPDTDAGVRDVATKVQNYLETTEALHQDLIQRSQGDAKAEEFTSSVQKARGVVREQVKAIHEATSVYTKGVGAPEMVPTGAPTVGGQAGTGDTHPGSGSSTVSDGVMVPGAASTPSGGTSGDGASSGGTPPGGTSGSTAIGSTGQGNPPALPLTISLLKANGLPDKDPIVIVTSALLAGHTPGPALQDKDIGPLIDAWRKAVDTFTTKLTAPDTSLQLASIVGLIELHAELEVLYDQLINIEESARVSVSSLLSIR